MSERQKNSLKIQQVLIDDDYHGQRIDNYLVGHLKGVPRSFVYKILRRGEIRVNKGRVRAGYRLQSGEVVRIPPIRLAENPTPRRPDNRVLRQLDRAILLETPNYLIINKPSGLAVHGGSGLSFGVIEALRWLRPEQSKLELVHRLDRETSGCLIISKKRSALRILHELMRGKKIEKRYQLLLSGCWDEKSCEVVASLMKNTLRGGERIVRVDSDGRPARTRFKSLFRYSDATLVEAEPITGRTHQIRVHAAYMGYPILGDTRYGDERANRDMRRRGLNRLFLHARSLRFHWPGEASETRVAAPLEAPLENLVKQLSHGQTV